MKRALLLSGGIDSIALAYWTKPDLAITLNYGQAASSAEIEAASAVAEHLKIAHLTVNVDCSSIGTGTMVSAAGNAVGAISPSPEWWPFRNQLIVTLAASKAIQLGCGVLMIGTVQSDSLHRDGQQGFIDRLDALLAFQEGEMRLCAPALRLNSIELVRSAQVPIEVLLWAHSCHQNSIPCGNCRGCFKYFEVIQSVISAERASSDSGAG